MAGPSGGPGIRSQIKVLGKVLHFSDLGVGIWTLLLAKAQWTSAGLLRVHSCTLQPAHLILQPARQPFPIPLRHPVSAGIAS